MQLMINTDTDSIASLRGAAAVLLADALAREAAPAGPTFNTEVPPPPPPPPAPPVIDVTATHVPPPPPPPPADTSHVPPPPPPPAPPPPAATTTAAAPGPLAERDSEGAVWSADLHASTKTKTADGKWKKKRNTGTKTETPPPPPPADTTGNVPPPPAATTAAPPPPPPPPAAAVEPTGPTFRSVMAKAKAAVESGKLTHDRVGELVRQAGAPDLTSLNAMAHLLPTVDALLDAELFGK